MMSIAFIVRFHYAKDDPRFEWRFKYFAEKVLPRILAQSGNFDICIRCNPIHDNIFKALHPRIKVFHVQDEYVAYKREKYFYDFVPFSRTIGLDRYDLQLGLDSDDLIEPDYLSTIIEMIYYVQEHHSEPEDTIHISLQPELIDVKTGEIHRMPQRYDTNKGSAFFALYQPKVKEEDYIFAYHESHLTIGRHFKYCIVPGKSDLCFASCHDHNESTHI